MQGGWRPVESQAGSSRFGMVAALARRIGVGEPMIGYAFLALMVLGLVSAGARVSRRLRRARADTGRR